MILFLGLCGLKLCTIILLISSLQNVMLNGYEVKGNKMCETNDHNNILESCKGLLIHFKELLTRMKDLISLLFVNIT